MLKQLRREEKRQEKQRVNRGDDTSEPEFNPAELRAQRQGVAFVHEMIDTRQSAKPGSVVYQSWLML